MCCTNMHARLGWFNANYVAFRILFDEVFANTGSGAPCTDTCYEIVNILACIVEMAQTMLCETPPSIIFSQLHRVPKKNIRAHQIVPKSPAPWSHSVL